MNPTILIMFAPVPLLILYFSIRVRLKRRKLAKQATPCAEKPYEPETARPPNAFLSRFPLTTQLFLKQQWKVTRFGFLATLWILTVMLCGSLFQPFPYKLPTADQRIWFSFVLGAGIWGSGIPILIALCAAIIASTGVLSSSSATYTRTRPIPLRVIFWGRMLPALAAFLLAAAISTAIAFCVLRIAYGPVWNSVPTSATADGAFQAVIRMPSDGTATLAEVRRLLWLARNPAPRIFASALTTMTLFFSAFVLLSCQPFWGNKKFSSGITTWIVPMTIIGVVLAISALKYESSASHTFRHITQMLFCTLPDQTPPPWRFLPVPIVLSVVLLFLSERFYLRRDI